MWKFSCMFIDDGDDDKDRKQQNLGISSLFIKCKGPIMKIAANEDWTLFNFSDRNLG